MNLRNLAIWGVIIVVVVGLYTMMNQGAQKGVSGEVSYSQLLSMVDSGHVKKATLRGETVEASDADGKPVTAVTPSNQDELIKRLLAEGAQVDVKPAGGNLALNILF